MVALGRARCMIWPSSSTQRSFSKSSIRPRVRFFYHHPRTWDAYEVVRDRIEERFRRHESHG